MQSAVFLSFFSYRYRERCTVPMFGDILSHGLSRIVEKSVLEILSFTKNSKP